MVSFAREGPLQKAIVISLLCATVVIPIVCARDPSPHRGLKRAILLIALFNAVYVALLVWVWIPLAQSGVVRP